MERAYQICARCVMDTSDPDIRFDETGLCNHCKQYELTVRRRVMTGEIGQQRLAEAASDVATHARNRAYDCVLGLSGGCDSTYVAYLAKKLRLRPYLVSLDNGYDSEITKRNLTAIAANLQTDLHTHRVEPGEFRDLQLAYLKAGVINIEVLTDHAILALLYRTAAKLRLRFILSGSNLVTEAILPPAWGGYSDVRDFSRIMDIYSRHGSGRQLETYPTLSLADFVRYNSFKRIRLLALLNYVSYVKKDVKTLLAREFQYEDYGPKHCESIFTRFFQFHILSRRLGVDKRRAHLSSLVMAAQMTRAEALAELTNPPYTEASLAHDRRYVADYLGIGEGELENLIAQPVRSLDGYRSDHLLRTTYAAVINPIAAAKWLVRTRQASP